METHYETLKVIYGLVKNTPVPTRHICHPGEVILQQNHSWDIVVEHLNQLQKEGFIKMELTGATYLNLTNEGLEWLKRNEDELI